MSDAIRTGRYGCPEPACQYAGRGPCPYHSGEKVSDAKFNPSPGPWKWEKKGDELESAGAKDPVVSVANGELWVPNDDDRQLLEHAREMYDLLKRLDMNIDMGKWADDEVSDLLAKIEGRGK